MSTNAALAQTPVDTTVKFVDLTLQTRLLEPALTAAWQQLLADGDFILGGAVDRLEREFAAYSGVSRAVGVDSGFSALELALRAAGCGPGDEVITQANSFVATVSAILACGARPVLVDPDVTHPGHHSRPPLRQGRRHGSAAGARGAAWSHRHRGCLPGTWRCLPGSARG